jgi:hypothetical protein
MIDRRTLLSGATFAAGAAMALPAVASVTAAWDAASARAGESDRVRSGRCSSCRWASAAASRRPIGMN